MADENTKNEGIAGTPDSQGSQSDAGQSTGGATQPAATSKKAAKKKSRRRKKRAATKAAKSPQGDKGDTKKRTIRDFPASTFEEALVLANAIQKYAAGQRVRRLTLFDHLGKSPDSGPSRQIMSNSLRYGLTTGTHNTDYLELTPEGKIATNPEGVPREQLKARFMLAIQNIAPFNALYEQFKGSKLPSQAVLRDFLLEQKYKPDEIAECVDTFIVNAKFLGVLRTIAGAERLVSLEHALEDLMSSPDYARVVTPAGAPTTAAPLPGTPGADVQVMEDWAKICFYLTPIGSPDSDHRRHSDLFLSHIVEPAVEEFGLRVVRADHIAKPGMITTQIIEHVIKSRIAIADLSFHNANVFYELSLRHAFGLPTVQIIRSSDTIPFDLNQVRTIQLDTSSIYTLVPQLETYRAEIANQVRRALNDQEPVGNPLTVYYPGFKPLQLTEGEQ